MRGFKHWMLINIPPNYSLKIYGSISSFNGLEKPVSITSVVKETVII